MQASNLAQAGHAFFALTHSMNMHGRAAAMVTPIGDKKTLLPAESAVSSSGCAGRGRLKSGTSRKKKWKHARLQGAQRREGVCVGLGCRGAECDFACFPNEGTIERSQRTIAWGAAPRRLLKSQPRTGHTRTNHETNTRTQTRRHTRRRTPAQTNQPTNPYGGNEIIQNIVSEG